jgi:hypothetical protein
MCAFIISQQLGEQQLDYGFLTASILLIGFCVLGERVGTRRINNLAIDLANGHKLQIQGKVTRIRPRTFKKNWLGTYRYAIWIGDHRIPIYESRDEGDEAFPREFEIGYFAIVVRAPQSKLVISANRILDHP